MPSFDSPVYTGPFTQTQACRLLWRAGFGPTPGQAAKLASLGLRGAVQWLTRPSGQAQLVGPEPTNSKGQPLDPVNVWGNDHCWWLDRMVRSDQPGIERLTLIWHSWFATSVEETTQSLMLRQNRMMRAHASGNFLDLFQRVTKDPAMLLWLSGSSNTKDSPNENYGREMMELFSLGADQGYDQGDVHQQARALTGWTNDWDESLGPVRFRFDSRLHDPGVKRIFGHRGRFDWRDSCRLCVQHPLHPAFFVKKLWGYFIPVPPPPGARRALEHLYKASGFETRPVVEAILQHPLLYEGPRMVTPPVVYFAGLMRGSGQFITTDDWAWIGDISGQRLFAPPNVAGWDYTRWLDTGTWMGRFTGLDELLDKPQVKDTSGSSYPIAETPDQALQNALGFWGNPELSSPTTAALLQYGRDVESGITENWQRRSYRILRQNALRALIASSPDLHTS